AFAAAELLAIQIANSYLAMKRQHVLPICEAYSQIGRDYETYQRSRAAGGVRVPFSYGIELKALSPLKLPIGSLEKLILEKTSLRGRRLAAAVEMTSTIDTLEKIIEGRNALIQEVKNNQKTERQK